ncbi:hypothetical protein FRC16_003374, partial [Serendipita sp. 398]
MASSALLQQIQAGRSLKKAVTNDRSAPLVEGAKKPAGGGYGSTPASAPSASSGVNGGAGAGAG